MDDWTTATSPTPLEDIHALADFIQQRSLTGRPFTARLRPDIAALIDFTSSVPIPLERVADALAAHNAGWDDLTWDGVTLSGRPPERVTTMQVPATLKGWD